MLLLCPRNALPPLLLRRLGLLLKAHICVSVCLTKCDWRLQCKSVVRAHAVNASANHTYPENVHLKRQSNLSKAHRAAMWWQVTGLHQRMSTYVKVKYLRRGMVAINEMLTPTPALAGSAEARYFGRGTLPDSIFRTSSCRHQQKSHLEMHTLAAPVIVIKKLQQSFSTSFSKCEGQEMVAHLQQINPLLDYLLCLPGQLQNNLVHPVCMKLCQSHMYAALSNRIQLNVRIIMTGLPPVINIPEFGKRALQYLIFLHTADATKLLLHY